VTPCNLIWIVTSVVLKVGIDVSEEHVTAILGIEVGRECMHLGYISRFQGGSSINSTGRGEETEPDSDQ
jgi:hypothetical protein